MNQEGQQVATPEFLAAIREAAGVPISEADAAAIHALALEHSQGGVTPAQHRKHLEAIAQHAAALKDALHHCDDDGLRWVVDIEQLARLAHLARSNAEMIEPRQGRRTDTALRELATQCLHAYRNAGGQGIGVSTDGSDGERTGPVLSLITAALRECGIRHIPSGGSIRAAIQHADRQGKK